MCVHFHRNDEQIWHLYYNFSKTGIVRYIFCSRLFQFGPNTFPCSLNRWVGNSRCLCICLWSRYYCALRVFFNEIICFKDFSQIRLLKGLSNVFSFLSGMHCSAEGSCRVTDESGPSRALVLLDTEGDGTTITRSVRNTDPTKERQSLCSTALCASNIVREAQ
jgi:hypothetical protein